MTASGSQCRQRAIRYFQAMMEGANGADACLADLSAEYAAGGDAFAARVVAEMRRDVADLRRSVVAKRQRLLTQGERVALDGEAECAEALVVEEEE